MNRDMQQWCEYLKLPVSLQALEAGRFLEQNGQRFLVDFGTQNAISKAHDLLGLPKLKRRCRKHRSFRGYHHAYNKS